MQFHFKNFRKRFSAFKFSPKLWDKPARTALGPFLRLWSTQTFSALGAQHRRRACFAQYRCALRVVRGRGARLAVHSADERQLRCAVPHPHSREDAGPRLRRAQFTAIFHHSAWVSPWWRARRYRLRAVHGSVNTRKPFLLPVRHRQRLRRRVFVPCPRLPRRRRLPLLPPQQAYPRAGSERQRLKS